jgi:hypothetical protein
MGPRKDDDAPVGCPETCGNALGIAHGAHAVSAAVQDEARAAHAMQLSLHALSGPQHLDGGVDGLRAVREIRAAGRGVADVGSCLRKVKVRRS